MGVTQTKYKITITVEDGEGDNVNIKLDFEPKLAMHKEATAAVIIATEMMKVPSRLNEEGSNS